MADDKPTIKHVTMTCPVDGCEAQAFVQVLIVDDPKLQKSIDTRADAKLFNALSQAHKEGEHNE